MKGFKDFLMRGNLVEIAVGLIMATSFGAVVASFTSLLLAAIAKVIGANPNFDDFKPAGLPVGAFVTAVVASARFRGGDEDASGRSVARITLRDNDIGAILRQMGVDGPTQGGFVLVRHG